MSEFQGYGQAPLAAHPAAPVGPEGPTQADKLRRGLGDLLLDAAVVALWFAVVGLLCAVIWSKVTPLPEFTRTTDNATMDEAQLARQVATDGWFFLIAAAGGLVSGVALTLLRRRSPVQMVLLVAAGGALATWLMISIGLDLGPADPSTVFAGVPVGSTVPVRIRPEADGIRFVWSIAALIGALVVLWGTEARDGRRPHAVTIPSQTTHDG